MTGEAKKRRGSKKGSKKMVGGSDDELPTK
jgi:hypothetical protein